MLRSEANAAVVGELRAIVRMAGGRVDDKRNVKAAIARAALRLGLSYRRARALWYADPSVAVRAAEADRLRAARPDLLREQRQQLLAEAAALGRALDALGE